jgi:hypothetical protein
MVVAARVSQDCFCTAAARVGKETPCPPCVAALFFRLRLEHPETLSVGMAMRRIQRLDGFTAAVAVEMSRVVLTGSPAHAANRERRYVERPPTDGG